VPVYIENERKYVTCRGKLDAVELSLFRGALVAVKLVTVPLQTFCLSADGRELMRFEERTPMHPLLRMAGLRSSDTHNEQIPCRSSARTPPLLCADP
jgi:hypothetical protein